MIVAYDASAAETNSAGSGRYAAALAEALRELPDLELRRLATRAGRPLGAPRTIRSRLSTLERDLLWTQWRLPRRAASSGAELLHIPGGFGPLATSIPTIVTVLDLSVLRYPGFFGSWQRLVTRIVLPRMVRGASRLIAISRFVAGELSSCLRVEVDKISVTPLAVSSAFRPQPDEVRRSCLESIGAPFVLTVGTLEPRKNVARLIRAIASLRSAGLRHKMVHVGELGWRYEEISRVVEELDAREYCVFLGRRPLMELVALYAAADVFVYPSLYEGFGLPVLEALSCGCPVVCSTAGALVELTGDAALQIPAEDTEAMESAIGTVLEQPGLRRDLVERGLVRAAEHSWERCARQTLDAYRLAVDART